MTAGTPVGLGPGGFALDKWYLDVVDERGRAFVGYVARLTLGGVTVPYAAWMTVEPEAGRPGGARVTHGGGFRGHAAVDGGAGILRLAGTRAQGTWRPVGAAYVADLLTRADGVVRWDCAAPAAEASVETDRGWRCTGRGYAERLQLTVPPWRLPIRELRWGRAVAAGQPVRSVVWIEWRGDHPLRLALVDGKRVDLDALSETAVRAGDVDLSLDRVATLREGALGRTVLARAGRLAAMAPPGVLGIRESKWLSRVRIAGAEGSRDGWAIHEVVSW